VNGLGVPIAALIVSLTAIIISIISNRSQVKQSYVKSLEDRIAYLEIQLELANTAKDVLKVKVDGLNDENHRLLIKIDRLQEQIDAMQLRIK